MKKLIAFLLVTANFFGCGDKQAKKCNCCETVYSRIDNAFSCIDSNPSETSYDNRLFLLAFTNSAIRSWAVIKDPEIVSVAKGNYLLIVLSPKELDEHKTATPELKNLVKKHEGEELFFVVTNQALYPFRDWVGQENKERIINELRLGNGP